MPISSGPIEDRLAIRELVESYNDAVMRFDAASWQENWTDDATWTLPGGNSITGRDNIVGAWRAAMANFSFVGFFASAGPILVDGDTATGTWYQTELLHQNDGAKRTVIGQYQDTYVKADGRWFFATRNYLILNAETN